MKRVNVWRGTLALLIGTAAVSIAHRAPALDTTISSPTYYEEQIGSGTLSSLESTEAGLPSALHVLDAGGGIEYRALGGDVDRTQWEAFVEVGERARERVDTVYDLVLALPLPDGFESAQWGITAREGSEAKSVPIIYAGEKVVLKRNVTLEKTWLPTLVGSSEGLPDLSGTGYSFTLWDAILRYDPDHGPSVQGLASFRYAAGASVSAPDPADPLFAGYLITWIPTLEPSIAPYTLRLDVRPAAGE